MLEQDHLSKQLHPRIPYLLYLPRNAPLKTRFQLSLQGKNKDVEISMLCFLKIHSPLPTTLSVTGYPHLKGLQLADVNIAEGSHPNSNILIGRNTFWVSENHLRTRFVDHPRSSFSIWTISFRVWLGKPWMLIAFKPIMFQDFTRQNQKLNNCY